MDEWKKVAEDFETKWNYPNCVGALDGKHVMLQKPPKSGSSHFNYKHTFSVVLMALVDADYRFIYVNVGAQGRMSDAGVFANSRLSKLMERNKLNLPAPRQLTNDFTCPYMVVGDEAFPLRENLMKPYHRTGLVNKEIIFNYRLSCARRVVENAFGILANGFRIFRAPIPLKVSSVKKVVLAATALHNYLRTRRMLQSDPVERVDYEDTGTGNITSGNWRSTHSERGLAPLPVRGGRIAATTKILCNNLSGYFSGVAAVPWQGRVLIRK